MHTKKRVKRIIQNNTFTILTSIPAKCKMGAAFFSNKLLAFLQKKGNYNNTNKSTWLRHSEGHKSVFIIVPFTGSRVQNDCGFLQMLLRSNYLMTKLL